MHYFAVIYRLKEGSYGISFPDFPEAFTFGQTYDEAIVMGADALAIAVEERAKARSPLPEPSTLDQARAWAQAGLDDPERAEGVDVSFAPMLQYMEAPSVDLTPVRISVSVAKSALETIDAAAKAAGMTRSGYLVHAALMRAAEVPA